MANINTVPAKVDEHLRFLITIGEVHDDDSDENWYNNNGNIGSITGTFTYNDQNNQSITITRIRFRPSQDNSHITFNRSGTSLFSIHRTRFPDHVWFIGTDSEVITMDTYFNSGGGFSSWSLANSEITSLNNLIVGDTVNFVLAEDTDITPVDVVANFEQTAYAVTEGSSVDVTVTLNTDPQRDVEIPFTYSPSSGLISSEYTAPSSVSFVSGETSKTITIDTLTGSADETLEIEFGTLPANVTAGTIIDTTITINAAVALTDVVVNFDSDTYTIIEGTDQEVIILLDTAPGREVIIPLNLVLSSGMVADHITLPNIVTFTSEQTSATITLSTVIGVNAGTATITFGTLPASVTSGANDSLIVTIEEIPTITVNFSESDVSGAEGVSITITVSLNINPEREVIIPLEVTNLDAETTDYSGIPNELTFASGQTVRTFEVFIIDDTLDDDDEDFTISFGSLPIRVNAGNTRFNYYFNYR